MDSVAATPIRSSAPDSNSTNHRNTQCFQLLAHRHGTVHVLEAHEASWVGVLRLDPARINVEQSWPLRGADGKRGPSNSFDFTGAKLLSAPAPKPGYSERGGQF